MATRIVALAFFAGLLGGAIGAASTIFLLDDDPVEAAPLAATAVAAEPPLTTTTDTPTSTTSSVNTTTTTTTTPGVTTTTTDAPVVPIVDSFELELPNGEVGLFNQADAGPLILGYPVYTYTVSVEAATGLDVDETAALVEETLSDPRGWASEGVGFEQVDEGAAFNLVIATPDTVDQLCLPLQTEGKFSCANHGRVTINVDRWLNSTPDWPIESVRDYQHMVINHEIGHIMGLEHVGCPGFWEMAPVMMQQTISLDGCVATPWVNP